MTYLSQSLWLAVALLVATIEPAHAYLDPGTGSIILQGIIGALAMGAVTARLYWNKITGFFKRRPAGPGERENIDAD